MHYKNLLEERVDTKKKRGRKLKIYNTLTKGKNEQKFDRKQFFTVYNTSNNNK